MDLSLDSLKEIFFDYNSDTLLDIFDETKVKAYDIGCMIDNPKSPEFINIILDNLIFLEDSSDDEDSLSE